MKSIGLCVCVLALSSVLVACGDDGSGGSGGSGGGDSNGGSGGNGVGGGNGGSSTGGNGVGGNGVGGMGGTGDGGSANTTSTGTQMVNCDDPAATAAECPDCLPSGSADCGVCCTTAEVDAYNELIADVVTACACESANAPCNDVCASDLCTGAQPTQGCIDCVNAEITNQGACVQSAAQTCAGSGTCAPVLQCFQTCPQ